ncbi:MAG TPA: serine/threonine-protein kinase [Polyangia bacterium]|nr:serine/threonine-protein kinase [Polyangia bacterium]
MSKPADPLLGQIIADRYQVIRLIGQGAMGAVYEVNQRRIGRSFALKRLAPGLIASTEALARFRREAEVVAKLRHPNIVEIVDWETLDDGSPCIIMEYLRGEDLATRLDRGPLAWPEVAKIGDQVLSALGVAHRAGIVHRDLKPQNIFLARDDAGGEHTKLLDFGVSKVKSAETRLTTDDRLIGTPLYMSPEQAQARPELVGPATDAWAMAAILFEMATGHPAFLADSLPSVLYRIVHGEPEALAPRRPDVPPGFVAVIRDALSRDPARRIADVEVLRRRLDEALKPVAGRAWSRPLESAGATEPQVAVVQPTDPAMAAVEPQPLAALSRKAASRPVVTASAVASSPADAPPPPVASGVRQSTLSHAVGERTEDRVMAAERPRRRRLAIAGGAAAAAIGAVALAVGLSHHPAPPSNPHVDAPPANANANANVNVNVNVNDKTPNEKNAAEKSGEKNADEKVAAEPLHVRVKRTPANAAITLDGAPSGEDVTFPADGKPHELVIASPGHVPFHRALDAATPRKLDVKLQLAGHKPANHGETGEPPPPRHHETEPPFIKP